MLFTVVESRDARLVAESEDRSVKLTLEGPHSFQVGQTVGVVDCTPFPDDDEVEVVAVGQPAYSDRPAHLLNVVTHDLSDEVPEPLERSDDEPLAEPTDEQ